ncbi:hypothetical protein [Prevotella melaninogenica]
MKKIYLLLLILNVVLMNGCKEQAPKQSSKQQVHQERTVKSEVDLIKKYDHKIREYYRELAEVGLDGVTVMPIEKKVEYTDLAVELNFEILKRMGFLPVSDAEAQKAIKKYYNIDISESNNSLFKKGLRRYVFKDGLPQERLDQRRSMDDGATETLFCFWYRNIFVPKYNYIIFHPIIEGATLLEGFDDEDADNNVLKKGKLSYRNDEELFYKNQFIFHDSKVALTWLMNNNRSFLRDLFLEYGYDKSDVINKMMIDEVKEEGELPIGKDYKELFVSKAADGRLLIHQGLLQYMLKHADRKNLYYCMLDEYLSYLLDLENEPEVDGLTKDERYKAGAYIGYYYGLMYEKCIGTPCDNQGFGYALYYQKDFISYIKKNNYFHLKDFDKIIQRQYDRYQEGVEIESHRMSGE